MRDYVLTDANSRDQTFAFPWVRRLVRNWLSRKCLRKLEEFDDHMLADIGLTRSDLRLGRSAPWDVDPVVEIIRNRERLKRRANHQS